MARPHAVPLRYKTPSQPRLLHWNASPLGKQLNRVNNIPFVETAATPPKPWLDPNLVAVAFLFVAEGLEVVKKKKKKKPTGGLRRCQGKNVC